MDYFSQNYPRADSALTLVIPLFNEEFRLQRSWEHLVTFVDRQHSGSRLILVDDGSEDNTAEVARRMARTHDRITVVQRPHLGKGAAVEFGIGMVETPLAGYTDVDLSTPLDEMERLFTLCEQRDLLVIGSRGASGAKVTIHQSKIREALGRMFNLWVRILLVPGIRDTQCGAKVAPSHVWRDLLGSTREQGFAWDAEIVALAIHQGSGVVEEPIKWSHDPSTRVQVLTDGAAMIVSVLRMRRYIKSSSHTRPLVTDGARHKDR
jgi:dolichyl-phosphate beta-glucosyltransferase